MVVSTVMGVPPARWMAYNSPFKWMMTGGSLMTQETPICWKRHCANIAEKYKWTSENKKLNILVNVLAISRNRKTIQHIDWSWVGQIHLLVPRPQFFSSRFRSSSQAARRRFSWCVSSCWPARQAIFNSFFTGQWGMLPNRKSLYCQPWINKAL